MKSRLNIAFFGSSLVSAYWNGAATYYRGIIRALDQLGHAITFYEPDAYDRQKHRDLADPDWARVVVYQTDTTDEVYRALSVARNADLVVKTSGVGAFDQLLESAILEMKAPHTLAAFWDVDAPATLDRLGANPHDPFLSLIPRYDLILTYGGGEPVVAAYGLLGARACIPIYNALDPDTHHPVPPDPRFACDLALLANRLPDREARVEEFFLNVAARHSQKEFVLGGNGWAGKPLTTNVTYVNHVYTRDHNAFNSTPRAVLNVNRESMARYGFSPPTRIFEAAGAAACIITDDWPGIDMFLEPGREVLVARDGDHVGEYLQSLTSERAQSVGKAARRRILSEHTYAHRAVQLQDILTGRYPTSTAARVRSVFGDRRNPNPITEVSA
jgi:spore maturation protein CgeB